MSQKHIGGSEVVHRLRTGLSTHRSNLETNFTVVNIKNKQPNYSEQREEEEENILSDKTRYFPLWTPKCSFRQQQPDFSQTWGFFKYC